MTAMLIVFGVMLILTSVSWFAIQWHNRRVVDRMQKEYLASLQDQYDEEEQELEELSFDLDASNYQFIYYHETLQ
jgi:hypothetical protein